MRRVVAVGGPNLECYYGDVHTSRYHTKDYSSNLGRSLTKRVSTRWRKAATGLRVDEDSPDSVERVRGAAGSGRRSASLAKELVFLFISATILQIPFCLTLEAQTPG